MRKNNSVLATPLQYLKGFKCYGGKLKSSPFARWRENLSEVSLYINAARILKFDQLLTYLNCAVGMANWVDPRSNMICLNCLPRHI